MIIGIHLYCGAKLEDIGKFFKVDKSSISNLIGKWRTIGEVEDYKGRGAQTMYDSD